MKNSTKGFSLIELLIVVAIILIIAAIAIPNLLRSRIAANQASAVGSLRTLNTAEITYLSTYNVGFTATMSYLAPPAGTANPTSTAAGLIDSVLALGSKSGYSFTYSPGASDATGRINTYSFTAVPNYQLDGHEPQLHRPVWSDSSKFVDHCWFDGFANRWLGLRGAGKGW